MKNTRTRSTGTDSDVRRNDQRRGGVGLKQVRHFRPHDQDPRLVEDGLHTPQRAEQPIAKRHDVQYAGARRRRCEGKWRRSRRTGGHRPARLQPARSI
jgi:hypothetical protein